MGFTFKQTTLAGAAVDEFIADGRDKLIEQLFKIWQPNPQVRRSMQRDRFPGPDPIPIMRRNIRNLHSGPGYLISDKTDGTRCLLFALVLHMRHLIVLLDRKMRVYNIAPLEMPSAVYEGTILDGELVREKTTGRLQYLIFDVVTVCGTSLIREPHVLERLRVGYDALLMQPHPENDSFILEMRWKHLIPIQHTMDVMQHMQAAAIHYEVDGAILTPQVFEIKPGSKTGIYKFKTGQDNTVDFLLRGRDLLVSADRGRQDVKVGELAGLCDAKDGDIVECKLVKTGWELFRVRQDKARPNSHETYIKTLDVIKENLALQDLLSSPQGL